MRKNVSMPMLNVSVVFVQALAKIFVRLIVVLVVFGRVLTRNASEQPAQKDGGQAQAQQDQIDFDENVHLPSISLTRVRVNRPGHRQLFSVVAGVAHRHLHSQLATLRWFGAWGVTLLLGLALSACGDNTPQHQSLQPGQTVEWFLANPEQRAAQLQKCADNPRQLMYTPNCLNARQAENDYLWQKGTEQPINIDASRSWERMMGGGAKGASQGGKP